MKKLIHYRVTSGTESVPSPFVECSTLKDARKEKKEMYRINPHQGGGHRIIKVTTIYEEIS